MTDMTYPRKRNAIELFHDFLAQAILYAVLLCWVLEATMNAIFGWRFAGGGLKGLPLAAVFVAIAVFAAYFPLRWDDARGWARKGVLALAIAACVGVSQYAGWANLGTLLADGATARDTQATTRATAADDVKRLRAELAGMTPPKRPVAAIEAALSLELRRKGKDYPNGDGPEALKLKQELAHAQTYRDLPGQIDAAQQRLADAPQVADGSPETEVARRMLGTSSQDVLFWAPVVLTMILGLLANFGLRLIGVRAPPLASFFGAHQPAAPAFGGHLPPPDIFDAYKGYDAHRPHARPSYGAAYRAPPSLDPASPAGPRRDDFIPNAHRPVSHAEPQPLAPVSSAPAAASNAPITINLGGATLHGAAAPSPPGLGAGVAGRRVVKRPALEGAPDVSTPPAGRNIVVAPQHTPAAAMRPVNRDHLNGVIDQLATFCAAELVLDGAGLIPFADLVERYRLWAQGRAIDPAAFAVMFPMATGIELIDIAGVQHWAGARLRRELKVVS